MVQLTLRGRKEADKSDIMDVANHGADAHFKCFVCVFV